MVLHPVVAQEMFGDDPRAAERRHDAEPRRDEARRMHGGLGDAEDRAPRHLSGGEQARIAEAGDHVAVASLALTGPHLFKKPDDAHGLVVMALDRDRTRGGRHGPDFRAGRGRGPRRSLDHGRHGGRRIGIDDLDAHGPRVSAP